MHPELSHRTIGGAHSEEMGDGRRERGGGGGGGGKEGGGRGKGEEWEGGEKEEEKEKDVAERERWVRVEERKDEESIYKYHHSTKLHVYQKYHKFFAVCIVTSVQHK